MLIVVGFLSITGLFRLLAQENKHFADVIITDLQTGAFLTNVTQQQRMNGKENTEKSY